MKHNEADFAFIKEETVDNGKVSMTLTVEEMPEENVAITFSFDAEEDKVCPYCGDIGTSELYMSKLIVEYRCRSCGKTYLT